TDWADRRIRLLFEGVDGLIKLWINDQPAGTNDIACLPSEFDITDFVRVGQTNTLVMTVEKSLVTYWSRRELGGITRDVSLIALPSVNLARLHIDTRVHSSTATANVHFRIANDGPEIAAGHQLRIEIRDADGTALSTDLPERPVRIPPLAPGQMLEMTVPVVVRDPRRWTAETPHLHTVHAALLNADTEIMSASQRFGFRELRVDGHKLLLNGAPIRLRGANYHITYPGLGESVPRELIRRDLELMRGANLNTLRSRPTPDVSYVELCDELGEAPRALVVLDAEGRVRDRGPLGDHGASMDIEPPFLLHVATMIESLYSHPSIITWGLGNECNYYEYFRTGALGARVADPTRPLFFGSDMRVGVDAPFMDINDDHYPRDGTAHLDDLGRIDGKGWVYPDTRPNIFTEWLHVHTNNVKEIAYDPGIDDFWGYAAVAHIEHMYRTPHFLGGFMFKAVPYRGVGVPAHWRGIFDEHRRINDLYWHNKKSHSPLRADELNPRWNADAQTVELSITNRFDFLNAAEIRFEWTQADQTGRASTDIAPQQTGTLTLPWNRTSDPIVIRAIAPDGLEVDRYRLTPPTNTPSTEQPAPGAWSIDENEQTVRVTIGEVVYTIDRTTGLLSSATSRGNPVLTGPPTLAIIPSQMTRFRGQQKLSLVNQIVDWQPERVEIDRQDDKLIITATGRYSRATGRFVTTLSRDAQVRIDYDFEWTADTDFNIFNTGLSLPVDAAMDTLSWDRRALWSDYPDTHIGRAAGEARATGDPAFTQARTEQHEGARPWPWSQDMIDGVTRDFRATRFNIHHASLRADDG
ncbi:MAG TPA: glycoside hydrolase family 2 TIM barrel-domain containing protein, partial [Tepidisphaeraceae bacterium]|nr:glycoside hydrolase family 2 TIM barrel-domain containing protein [Tepidisphaeraceae bacterium]